MQAETKVKENTRFSFAMFFKTESSSAVLLLFMAALAFVIANSSYASLYEHILHLQLPIGSGELGLSMSVHHWINDGLMVVFFLLVGLEIKREFLHGELSTRQTAALPLIGALGGMLVPALIFYSLNKGLTSSHGWAIPTATDIAFALGVLAVLGPRVPAFLKIFLSALAIIDDLGAILVIAFIYTSELSVSALGGAACTYAALLLLNRFGVSRVSLYLGLGFVLWMFILKSGVHATIAGVLTASAIPASAPSGKRSALETLESALHSFVAFVVMPVFALANAGVALGGQIDALGRTPLSLGILLGLLIGKPCGVMGSVYLANKTKVAIIPAGVSRKHLLGVGLLAGIGFTMSLFIATLAFSDPNMLEAAKISVLTASTIAGVLAYALLVSR